MLPVGEMKAVPVALVGASVEVGPVAAVVEVDAGCVVVVAPVDALVMVEDVPFLEDTLLPIVVVEFADFDGLFPPPDTAQITSRRQMINTRIKMDLFSRRALRRAALRRDMRSPPGGPMRSPPGGTVAMLRHHTACNGLKRGYSAAPSGNIGPTDYI